MRTSSLLSGLVLSLVALVEVLNGGVEGLLGELAALGSVRLEEMEGKAICEVKCWEE